MLTDKGNITFILEKKTNIGQKITQTTDTAQVCFPMQSKWNQICTVSALPHSVSYAYSLTSSKANYPYKGNRLTRKNSSAIIKLVNFLCR